MKVTETGACAAEVNAFYCSVDDEDLVKFIGDKRGRKREEGHVLYSVMNHSLFIYVEEPVEIFILLLFFY